MRILVVSAHFPPNFVSGGTLVPQRHAQELRRRGHEVSVYAGWIGDDRPPLETWTDVDETGMPVRWIVTTPWIWWDLRENWDNAAIAADFARHLAEIRPDVVHLHSLQTLGGSLVRVAAEVGCRVIVTMHDFWWVCSRQFLVNRDYVPCCPVVDAGICPCEVDRPWLDTRNRWLREELTFADRVLTVSASAAELLRANGVATERLLVDENGIPAVAHERPPPSPASHGGPLRFLYTGGADRMKGVHVLLAAAAELKHRDDWRLVTYGIQDHIRDFAPDLTGLPIDVLPPFRPDEVESVFGAADVLVVPSVMRESQSIVTREGLQRGLALIVSDTFGPEEVVDHEANGLVVTAGDPAQLAGAMRRLLDDRPLLERLRGSGTAIQPRTIDEQVTGLEALYREVVVAPAAARLVERAALPRVKRVVFLVGIEGAPLRYRARLPAEALALIGVESEVHHYRDQGAIAAVGAADVVVVYRVPATHQILDLLERTRRRGVPVLFDVDDLIFDPDLAEEIPALRVLPEAEAALWMQGVRRYRSTMEACDGFIGSTERLCDHAARVTGLPTFRFANGVGVQLAQASDRQLARPRVAGPVRIGYLSGTTTHDEDWRFIEPAVIEVMEARPDVELWLGGYLSPSNALAGVGSRVRRLPFIHWSDLPSTLRDLDVNLAPLSPAGGRFNEAKSAIKWLEAALVGTPTVATPTAPFQEVIEPGRTGLLASDHAEWVGAIDALVALADLRDRLGHAARRRALLTLSPHLQAVRYLSVLEAAHVGNRAATWTPTSLDEPWGDFPLEPYGAGPPAFEQDGPMTGDDGSSASPMTRVRRTFEDRGAREAVRAAARVAARSGGGLARRLEHLVDSRPRSGRA